MRFSPALAVVLVAMPCRVVSANPAARMTDPTSHGGLVVAGSATVLIGGLGAARLGDMAVCPLSEGPVPHVGGPIVTGSATVLINGMPAARVGDTIAETGPPSVITAGAPTVLVGGSASAAPVPAGGPAPSR